MHAKTLVMFIECTPTGPLYPPPPPSPHLQPDFNLFCFFKFSKKLFTEQTKTDTKVQKVQRSHQQYVLLAPFFLHRQKYVLVKYNNIQNVHLRCLS